MRYLLYTGFEMAQRFVGLKEVAGAINNDQIIAMLRLDTSWPQSDEVPWCSAFVNYVCWLLRLPRSKSLLARSWLSVGAAINIDEATPGFDVVILDRTGGADKVSETAAGHVGFFAGLDDNENIYVLGGNQGNSVNVSAYKYSDMLGIRRLREVI